MLDLLNSGVDLLTDHKALKNSLLNRGHLTEKKVAVLGGATTDDLKDLLELFLLNFGIKPSFYQSDFQMYYEEAVFDNERLFAFAPDIVYIYTSSLNLREYPNFTDDESAVDSKAAEVLGRFREIWDSLSDKYRCPIIQNNFENPSVRLTGNLAASDTRGSVAYVARLNEGLADMARNRRGVYICDIDWLSAWFGLSRWRDARAWYSWKSAVSVDALPYLAHNVANIVGAIFGQSKKCLVLDLDNTLWGGVVGDDGVSGLEMGEDTPQGQAFADFQRYILRLKERGILLAINSKNELENVRQAFGHPDMLLKEDDFVSMKVNWDLKTDNLIEMARELNLGLNSFVFVDDNPAEREFVRQQLPEVFVPEVGSDPERYVEVIEMSGCFETVGVSAEDANRSRSYAENKSRAEDAKKYSDYAAYLESLQMEAEIAPFSPVYYERISQLTNKTNQFNLTTRRYSVSEIEQFAADPTYWTFYVKLKDKWGDYGLISVLIAEKKDEDLHIDTWLMSCRVFQRGVENALFDALLKRARENGIKKIYGYYSKTAKNVIVSDLYGRMGFTVLGECDGINSEWMCEVDKKG